MILGASLLALSNGWSVILSIILTPLYIRLVGVEGYAAISAMLFAQGILVAFDFGVSASVNRQLAVWSARPQSRDLMVRFIEKRELFVCCVGALLALSLTALSNATAPDASMTGRSGPNSLQELRRWVPLLALAIAAQWPIGFYSNGLLGLQRMRELTIAQLLLNTIKGLGGIVALVATNGDLTFFLVWQIAVGLIASVSLRHLVYASLPTLTTTTPSSDVITSLRFSLGVTIVIWLGIALTHADKLWVSGHYPLTDLAYYGVAVTLATLASRAVGVIASAAYPVLSTSVAAGDMDALTAVYRRASQLSSAIAFSVIGWISTFSEQILSAWLADSVVAQRAAPIAILLAWGYGLQSLVGVTYQLQLAFGQTRLAVYINAGFALLMVAAIMVGQRTLGLNGIACGVVVAASAYLFLFIVITHRHLLPRETAVWFKYAFVRPCLLAFSSSLLCLMLIPIPNSRPLGLFALAAIGLLTFAMTALGQRDIRTAARDFAKALLRVRN